MASQAVTHSTMVDTYASGLAVWLRRATWHGRPFPESPWGWGVRGSELRKGGHRRRRSANIHLVFRQLALIVVRRRLQDVLAERMLGLEAAPAVAVELRKRLVRVGMASFHVTSEIP